MCISFYHRPRHLMQEGDPSSCISLFNYHDETRFFGILLLFQREDLLQDVLLNYPVISA